MKKLWMVVFVALIASGCSSVRELTVGESTVYQVTTRDLFAPCTTTLMQNQEGNMVMVNGGIGSGAVGTLAGPAAAAYAGHQVGRGLSDSGDDLNIENKSESNPITSSEANPVANAEANPVNISVSEANAVSKSSSKATQKSRVDVDLKPYKHLGKR